MLVGAKMKLRVEMRMGLRKQIWLEMRIGPVMKMVPRILVCV